MERTTILERIRDLNKEYIKTNTVALRQKLADVMVDNATAILSAIYTARGLCFSVNTMEWDIYKYHEIKENIQKLVEELDLDLECLDKEDRGKETDDTDGRGVGPQGRGQESHTQDDGTGT